MHLRSRWPGRLPDGQRLLGALLPGARHPGEVLFTRSRTSGRATKICEIEAFAFVSCDKNLCRSAKNFFILKLHWAWHPALQQKFTNFLVKKKPFYLCRATEFCVAGHKRRVSC
jgi:hypothetical protein